MKSFLELTEASKTFDLGFELEHAWESKDSLKLNNHYNPISLGEHEAWIVYNNVTSNDLKAGIEIATAFGISAAVMGQALLQTGGKLVTIDAYIEENFNSCIAYNLNTPFVKKQEECDGFKMANCLIEHLGLVGTVITEIGWSPDDVPSIITRNYSDTKLDFAFIDGGHTVDQIAADVNVLLPYLDDNCIVVFHDYNAVGPNTVELMGDLFTEFKRYGTHFDLAMYARGNKKLI